MDILGPHSPSEATSSAATVVSAAMGLPTSANSSEEAATAKSSEIPGLAAMDTEAPPVPAPEAWHRIVPPVRFFDYRKYFLSLIQVYLLC